MKNLPKHNKLSLGLISGLVEGQFVFSEKKISISNVVLFSMKQWQTQSILIQCKDSQFSSNQFFANKKKETNQMKPIVYFFVWIIFDKRETTFL